MPKAFLVNELNHSAWLASSLNPGQCRGQAYGAWLLLAAVMASTSLATEGNAPHDYGQTYGGMEAAGIGCGGTLEDLGMGRNKMVHASSLLHDKMKAEGIPCGQGDKLREHDVFLVARARASRWSWRTTIHVLGTMSQKEIDRSRTMLPPDANAIPWKWTIWNGDMEEDGSRSPRIFIPLEGMRLTKLWKSENGLATGIEFEWVGSTASWVTPKED